ncbi:hypothetical protein [Burkholderia cepacia]|uniref:hypothetical protein n=1 Tax=Burkholderia cepacia TaxID=292 RepID=UPI0009C095AE|nr:hypothetical protein [Burkholderia cepacia]
MTNTVLEEARTRGIDGGKRYLLTPRNLIELGITWESLQPLLQDEAFRNNELLPDGISINETTFGNWSGPTAATLGWMSYMNIGVPLIEERADIIQPAADVLSTRSYVNLGVGDVRDFSDTVEFSISNTISWSLEGTAQLTFGGRSSSEQREELQQSLEHDVADTISATAIMHAHKDNQGTQTQSRTDFTTTDKGTVTAIGSSTGTGELHAQLLLGITGSVSGSLTTAWKSSSTVSGSFTGPSRVETMATQRRQIKQFTYELPVTFAGYVALHYPNEGADVTDSPPQIRSRSRVPEKVIASKITRLKLFEDGEPFRPKGVAETVSALDVEHVIFGTEAIQGVGGLGGSAEPLSKARRHYL